MPCATRALWGLQEKTSICNKKENARSNVITQSTVVKKAVQCPCLGRTRIQLGATEQMSRPESEAHVPSYCESQEEVYT